MKEELWEKGKLILEKSGEAITFVVGAGAKGVKKGVELTAKGLQSERAQKLRPAMGIIMCVSLVMAVVSGIWYFSGKKHER